MISPYENLANAIVELAAKDYRKALKDLKRSPRNDAALQMKAECERFFRSDGTRLLLPWMERN